ncbi:MAG TPA: LacI family DNA-binding transcriptional regulator [Anaerolineaceae bacterium]|nr:LacI family DNA-binding transcriptional regulator [Anaerolineaceae bacterium]
MTTNKRITITDVARAAGVSPGTASRVLNQRGGDIKISEVTRKHVLDIAENLGYQPNPFAAALRTQKTGVIGVIVRDLCDPFLCTLAKAIQREARGHAVDVLFAHAEYDLEAVGHHLAFMHSHWFDGLVLLGDMPGDQAIINELQKSHTPFVAVARGEQNSACMVNVDERMGIRLGMDYLRGLGHERIAFIGNLEHGGVKERAQLFEAYLTEENLPAGENSVQFCANQRSSATECAQSLLSRQPAPTALFCGTDLVALSALNAAHRLGLNIPEQVSILGFDDIPEAAEAYPALTTLRQPVGTMAQEAVRLLMERIDGDAEESEDARVILPPELVVRASCTPPPG